MFIYFINPTVDTTPPVSRNCPEDITMQASTTSVSVSWTEPTATDNSGTAVTKIRSHRPGMSFTVPSTTMVTYTFRDSSGLTSTCTFTVTTIPGMLIKSK